ncbi:MAG: amino acid adenylation domain-containing protein [candidate division KSB1 bacterium]|nr:amino acid adenylation domain-containing protein [candidate division KSB1 bacterium]
MTDYTKMMAVLSPQKRAVLELKLKQHGNDYNSFSLSFSQQRLWFIDQLQPGNPIYNIPSAFRLEGELNVRALERSLNEVIARHEVLRTSFLNLNGEPVQIVAPKLQLKLPVIDLTELSPHEAEARVLILARQEAQRPFDLKRPPLMRVTLIKLNAREHIALLTLHHIIADGWSMGILIRELATLYQAFSNGRPSPLAPLKLQYADFARWQKEYLQGETLERQLRYWKEKLGIDPAVLELPTDFPRPAQLSFEGASLPVELPKELVAELHRLGRQANVTLFMTLLAGFQTLLHRYTGQDEISVGSPIANRTRKETEDLIGFFVNTLVFHTDLSGDPSFNELLARVKETTLGAYAHQDVPFEKLVEVLQPQRNLSHTPLFQVMLVLQNTPNKPIQLPNLTLRPLLFDRGVAQFDLSLNVGEVDGAIKGMVEFNTRLFLPDTIHRMMEHFKILLQSAVEHPELPISLLSMLSAAEREHILVDWNKTENDYDGGQCIHQLFEQQVRRTPQAIAVEYQSDQISYQELNARANQLAQYLRKFGVKPDQLVGLCLDRSIEMIVGLLGILKAGAAYVPLDPSYPAERLSYILADSGVSVVVTLKRFSAAIPGKDRMIVFLDEEWPTISQESDENPENLTLPENLAYMIYTSGSTGQPKGVMLQHRSVVNLWSGLRQTIYSNHEDRPYRVSLNAPLLFDASVQQLVMLLSGHTLCIIPQDIRLDGEAMLAYLRDKQIEVLDCVPSQLKLLISAGMLEGNDWTPSILLPGGEAIDHATWQMLRQSQQVATYNMYGPTECAVDSTICVVKEGPERPAIGRPINNVTHFVLDRHMVPVPIGVPGELYIGGDGLARGYHRRQQLTAERFVPNPFSTTPGSRLYRTGDLVRYLPDGQIEFLGRVDHQVKLRGFRIELGEIEATLKRFEGIKEAVVIVREDLPENKVLVAYLVASTQNPPSISALKDFLKGRLPEYMVPAAFVYLEQLPLTPNAKINRRALPAPDWSQLAEESFIAPRTPVEELVASIYGNILKIDRVAANANFFELGGHSLLATQVISRIREILKVELPLRDLFEAPTVAELAQRVERVQRQGTISAAPPIVPVPRTQDLPLSFAQQRLWFLDQLEPESPLYNIPMGFRLTGKLNVAALHKSLNAIVERHENLRTSFINDAGKAKLMIAPKLVIPLPLVDLQELPAQHREAVASEFASEEIRRPFKLDQLPLLRALLFRLTPEDHIIVVTMHHIISDGWSSQVLISEMAVLYRSFLAGMPSPLPALNIQYADFAYWQRNWLQGEVLEAQLNYWKNQLADCPDSLELPTDFPRPAVQTSNGDHFPFALPKALAEKLNRLSREHGATLFMTLLAAFQTLLYRYTGQDDICVGTPIANRNRAEIEGLIGFFVNTLVLRTRLTGQLSFKQLLDQVKTTTLDAYMHQDVPFEKIVDAVQPHRDMSHSPLFQVMFTLQNVARHEQSVEGLTLRSIELDTKISTFDLTLLLFEGPDGISGAFEYNTDLFKPETISRMAEHFRLLLERILENPAARITDLSILTPAQERLMLDQWNDTMADFPKDKAIHELFEAQAHRTPEAIAVIYEDQALSYRELNERANQLALALKQAGVTVDVPVGLCLDRSLELIVGILGILKAGGCYVPLDPRYPADRLAFMINDANLTLIVTQQSLVHSLEPYRAKMICLDRDWPGIAQQPRADLKGTVSPQQLAYVIYTSGSTGRPKGVMVEHRSVVNHNLHCIAQFRLRPGDRVLQFATINFDTAVEEIFPTLLSGATLVLRSADDGLATGVDLMEMVKRYQLTVLDLPTAYWQEWVYEMTLNPLNIPDSLRLVIVGGDKASSERLASWRKIVGNRVQWLNTYGPTEGTIIATSFDPDDPASNWQEGTEVPIGRPIANAKIYILDRDMRPVPVGVKGTLYIGGAGVARGYLNRPDLTAEKFIPDPFSKDPGERIYNTGDLARYRSDGTIEFIGRQDHQVKIRGFRIELSEIEAELEKHKLIREVAVVAREDESHTKRLIAYCVPAISNSDGKFGKRRHVRVPFLSEASLDFNGNQRALFKTEDISEGGARLMTISPIPSLDAQKHIRVAVKLPSDNSAIHLDSQLVWQSGERIGVAFRQMTQSDQELLRNTIARLLENKVVLMSELRGYLKQRLPDYMIPSAFVILDRLPRTATGKIDRRNLPAPDPVRLEMDSSFIAPRNPVEEKLSEIWRQVLGVKRISMNDNFFELGGDSILGIQVIAKANQAGLKLSPKQIFEHPTIAGLASVANMGQNIQAEQALVIGKIELTPIQRWFFSQNFAEPHHYNQSVFFEVKERLNPEILKAATEQLQQHHDALRIRYRYTEFGWEQYIPEGDVAVPFELVDLSSVSDLELSQEIERHAARGQRSLSLEQGPVVRLMLIDCGPHRAQRLLIVIHHLVVDGVSWRILLEDLQTLYHQLQAGRPTKLPAKTTSFQYWARRLNEYAQSESLKQQAGFWLNQFKRSIGRIPFDFESGDNTEASERTVVVGLNVEDTTEILKTVPAAYHAQINEVLLTALTETFYHFTGVRQLFVDLEGHGRADLFAEVDLSRTVGWFTAVYPVVLDLRSSRTRGESVKMAKEQLRKVPDQGIGFGILKYLCNDPQIRHQMQMLPKAPIVFNYLGQFDQQAGAAGIFAVARESKGPERSHLGQRSHIIEINGSVSGGKLQFEWKYSENLMRRSTVEHLAQTFISELRGMIAHSKSSEIIGFTPSDFRLAKLSQKKLDKVMQKLSKTMERV